MPYEHNLPAELNPEGDYCVPLYIPHHPDYTALILGVLRTLEEVERYERDPNYDNENAKIVAANWRDRTLTPLIEAIATGAPYVKHSLGAMVLSGNQTRSNSTFATVSGATLAHTFTKKNAKVAISNIRASLSNATEAGQLRVALSAGNFVWQPYSGVVSTTARDIRSVATFGEIPTGVSTNILLQFAATGGATITVFDAYNMIVEIEEWD